jgi:hypothetical protein
MKPTGKNQSTKKTAPAVRKAGQTRKTALAGRRTPKIVNNHSQSALLG